MDKQITIAANTNTNPLRAIMYETSAPNVAVQAIDIPLPHNVSPVSYTHLDVYKRQNINSVKYE